MPSDRMRHTILWNAERHAIDAELSAEYVWRQTRIPEAFDYAPAPDGYALISAGAGMGIVRERLHLHLTVRNLLNASYREYLNRLRYYADDTGRSMEIRLRYKF